MIIVGYQGIGKSSIAGQNGIIDLESGNFWFAGKRRKEWYVYYCNIAEHLSRQGYTVMMSSHKEVRDYLKIYSKQSVYCIFPALELKDEWLKRLKDRYSENIKELKEGKLKYYEIRDMDYRLQDIVFYLEGFDQEWGKK